MKFLIFYIFVFLSDCTFPIIGNLLGFIRKNNALETGKRVQEHNAENRKLDFRCARVAKV